MIALAVTMHLNLAGLQLGGGPRARPQPGRAAVARARAHVPLAQLEASSPNALQSEAIRSRRSAVLVLASAGTGKTRVLRSRIAYLLLSEHVPAHRILTVAFSQHAVQQGPVLDQLFAGHDAALRWRSDGPSDRRRVNLHCD